MGYSCIFLQIVVISSPFRLIWLFFYGFFSDDLTAYNLYDIMIYNYLETSLTLRVVTTTLVFYYDKENSQTVTEYFNTYTNTHIHMYV